MPKITRNKKGQLITAPSSRPLGRSKILYLDQEIALKKFGLGRGVAIRIAIDHCLTNAEYIFYPEENSDTV